MPPELPQAPNPYALRRAIAVLVIFALPWLVAAVEKSLWTAPHGVYAPMGMMMALPFLLFGLGIALVVVSVATIGLVLWARIGSGWMAVLLLYALGMSSFLFFVFLG